MVFKLFGFVNTNRLEFENDVKMYGIQTKKQQLTQQMQFENDVKMYGIQTYCTTVSY